ncbi:MAG: hypothetical protein IPM69_14135 [Ignavibacteria bacterium]|nr:hypothetical protein [Ignavibacteria bacterium]
MFVLLMIQANVSFAQFPMLFNRHNPDPLKGGYTHVSLYCRAYENTRFDTSKNYLICKNTYNKNAQLTEKIYCDPGVCFPYKLQNSYDSKGMLLYSLHYKLNDSNYSEKISYTYNAGGKVTEEFSTGPDRAFPSTLKTIYNAAGRIDSIIQFTKSSKVFYKKRFQYSSTGYQSEEVYFNEDGSRSSSITDKFDINGNLLQKSQFNEKGLIDWITYYTYNTNNQQTEVRTYNSKGLSTHKETIRYDTQGNKTEHITYNPDKSVDAFTYQYNMRRKGQKRVLYYPETSTELTNEKSSSYNQYLDDRPRNGAIESKRLYRYDKQGLLLEESLFDAKGGIESHILYSYDLYGNCSGYVEYDATNKPVYKTEFVYSR